MLSSLLSRALKPPHPLCLSCQQPLPSWTVSTMPSLCVQILHLWKDQVATASLPGLLMLVNAHLSERETDHVRSTWDSGCKVFVCLYAASWYVAVRRWPYAARRCVVLRWTALSTLVIRCVMAVPANPASSWCNKVRTEENTPTVFLHTPIQPSLLWALSIISLGVFSLLLSSMFVFVWVWVSECWCLDFLVFMKI